MTTTQLIAYLITLAIPALAFYMLFSLDLFGTGKRSTIVICFAWGIIAAAVLSKATNRAVLDTLNNYEAVVQLWGPIIEEIYKALILVFFIFQPSFRYAVDGAIYGFAVGIGFSVAENFYYLGFGTGGEVSLTLAISRVLSTALMHATTTAAVGIALGRLRRSRGSQRLIWSVLGITIAMIIHLVFNNLVTRLQDNPVLLLVVGIGIGVGGSALVAFQIIQTLNDEKQRFKQTLNTRDVGVTAREVTGIQKLGQDSFEQMLEDLGAIFGKDKISHIRRMFALQANIGILRGNLSNPASERLRKAWQEEIDTARREMDEIRQKKLGINVMMYLRNVFPSEEAQDDTAQAFREKIAESDPTHVHKFDLFMMGSARAGTLSPEQLEKIAHALQASEFFSELSLADLENLSRAAAEREYDPDEVLFKEGDVGDTMYMIEQGEIEIFVKENGAPKVINVRRAGEIVGDLALLDGYPRSASARAKGQLRVLMLRRDNFLTFLRSRPQVMMAILKFLSRSVRITTEIIETSATWVTHITQGNYAQAQKLAIATPATLTMRQAAQPSDQSIPASVEAHIGLEGVSEATPTVLKGIFSKVTSALEERETAHPNATMTTKPTPSVNISQRLKLKDMFKPAEDDSASGSVPVTSDK
ncbi:MAG: PrsW family intramembrane metalloprotease [Anaerolineae bacterium]|nr:PrsW family intramembrane metalloprotease [Anaerolineae bacterium]